MSIVNLSDFHNALAAEGLRGVSVDHAAHQIGMGNPPTWQCFVTAEGGVIPWPLLASKIRKFAGPRAAELEFGVLGLPKDALAELVTDDRASARYIDRLPGAADALQRVDAVFRVLR